MRWAIVALAVIAPPMFVGWSLFRAAALGDCDGDRYVANTQVAVNTGTHVITVKKRKMDNE